MVCAINILFLSVLSIILFLHIKIFFKENIGVIFVDYDELETLRGKCGKHKVLIEKHFVLWPTEKTRNVLLRNISLREFVRIGNGWNWLIIASNGEISN